MRVTVTGRVTSPVGVVTVIAAMRAPDATRPITSIVSSATCAPRSRGTARSTAPPRSTVAPSHTGRSAISKRRSAARAAALASPTRSANAPRDGPASSAMSASSPTPRPKRRTGRGSFDMRSRSSLSDSSPTVGAPSPMYTTAPRRAGSRAAAAAATSAPRSVAPPRESFDEPRRGSPAAPRRRAPARRAPPPRRPQPRVAGPHHRTIVLAEVGQQRRQRRAREGERAVSVAADASITIARSSPPEGSGSSVARSGTST